MTRVGWGGILVAIGYLLVYAGVADGGKYATRPWDALGA